MVTAPLSAIPAGEQAFENTADRSVAERPRFDPFLGSGPEDRAREQQAYLEYLRARDGEIDFEGWDLPKRRARLQELLDSPQHWDGSIDLDGFYQLFHRAGRPDTDDATRWASLIALANEGELYGVEIEERTLKGEGEKADPLMVFHVLQEQFHTELIAEACRSIGIEKVTLLSPRIAHRLIIRGMSHLPNGIRYAMVLLGEVIATVVFERLGELTSLFASTPAAEERLRSIIEEIRHDEILHTLHCRSRLSPLTLRLARSVIPITAWITEIAYPQIRQLGIDRHTIAEGLRCGIEIPEGVDWVTPDPITAR